MADDTLPPANLPEHCKDHNARLREVEDTMRDLSTIKKLVGGILLLGLPAVVSGLYSNIVNATEQRQMAAQVARHETSLANVSGGVVEIRSDLRVLITEFRVAEDRRQERDRGITERLQRLEAPTLTATTRPR
jgi:hypothetical protein